MPLLAVLDEGAHGALEESLKSLYVQNSETKQFYLDVAPDEAAKIAFNLQKQFENKKTELTNKHKELNEIKSKVAAYEGLGKSAEEIKAALESNRPEAVTELITKHQAEIDSLKKSYEEPLTQEREKAKRYEAQIQKSLADAEISKMVATYELDPETAPAILRDYVRAVPKEEGSDEYRTQIFENGQPALVAGQPMTGEQLLNGWREGKKFQRMFLAGDGGGSGAPAKQGGAFGGKEIRVSRASVKADINVYKAAEEQAAKVGGQVVLTD